MARLRRYKALVVVISLVTSTYLLSTASHLLQEYVSRGQDFEQIQAVSGRVKAWEMAYDALQDGLIFGHGFLAFSRVYILGIGGTAALLNSPLEVLVGTGLVGFIPWAAAVIWPLLIAVRPLPIPAAAVSGTEQRARQAQMLGVMCLVVVRSFTSSSLAMHEHPFMLFLAAASYVGCVTRGRMPAGETHRLRVLP
jgi:O-antigen ligase